MQRHRHERAHEHIVRARHDLHRFLLSDIDLTNLQFVRVGVLFQRHDAPGDNMGDVLPRADHILHGVARHDERIHQRLQIGVDLYIILQPSIWYFHCFFLPQTNWRRNRTSFS